MHRVAYYAHHHGSGHLRHAQLAARNPEIHMLVMTGAAAEGFSSAISVVNLPDDLVVGHVERPDSPFHYTPSGRAADAVRKRFKTIHDALEEFVPDVVVVDVSSEVAAFCKLSGYRVITRRMCGNRSDAAHRNTYSLADGLVAYFPSSVESDDFERQFRNKTTYLGMVELPLGRTRMPTRRVTVLTSLGGEGVDLHAVNEAAAASPHWQWHIAGLAHGRCEPVANVVVHGVSDDVAGLMDQSSVVITATGHNAVRAAAAARRGVLFMPEARPFDEQLRFAQQLTSVTGVPTLRTWDQQDWPDSLERAAQQDRDALHESLFVPEAEFHARYSEAIERALSE